MGDVLEEFLRGGICGKPQFVTTIRAAETTGTRDEQKTHGAHVTQEVGSRSFCRARLGQCDGIELKTLEEVVRQDADLLPGGVGGVVPGGHRIRSELAFEFGCSDQLVCPSCSRMIA